MRTAILVSVAAAIAFFVTIAAEPGRIQAGAGFHSDFEPALRIAALG
jgi:hypothetical protein